VLSLEEKRRLLVQKLQKKAQGGSTFPLSFAQRQLWLVHQMDPAGAAYNLPYALRLRGELDGAVLQRALDELVRRHETLRTVFAEGDDGPVQRVLPPRPLPVREVDLGALPEGEREAEAARLARADALQPFDLSAGPLLRVSVVRMGPADTLVLFTLHHIVSDAWSQDVLARDLSELYSAFAAGREPRLPALPIQYADYAAWQRGWLTGAVLDAELSYWRRRLAGAPPLLELPTDRPRTAAPAARGGVCAFTLAPETAERLRELARSEGATLFMTLLAAWQAVLARWTGEDDVVVGTPVAGRSRLEVENLIGFFVNMLPLRADLSGDPEFATLVGRVREAVLEAHAHAELPFEALVDALAPERTPGSTPLFQTVFALQPAPREALRLGGIDAAPAGAASEHAKFDLNLTMSERGGGLSGTLRYRTDLFDDATAGRMAAQLRRVLEQVAADPAARVSTLELLDDAERRRVLEEWNATDAPFPDGPCLHELIEGRARIAPDAAAVDFAGSTLSYAELDVRANRLAHELRERGVRPETRVALCFEPCAEMIVSLLAVLKAGGAYVPLDPASPPERLSWMLADAGAALVLADAPGAAALPADAPPAVRVDGDDFAARPGTRPESGVAARNLAYVIYTSGSTGRPKGVLVEHRGVCNSATAYVRTYGIRPGSRLLLFAPLHFDASVLDVFTALCSGATLVVASRDAMLPGDTLAALVAAERITHLKITPSALAVTPAVPLPELEAVMVGGESCSAELVARWAPGRRFFNGYGATEHSVRFTAMRCEPGPFPPPVGSPIANTRAYVLDARLRPVPVGVVGEVYMAGLATTRGYLNRPGLSAERFLPDPFSGVPGARMYRSGDRGRWLDAGVLEFAGRVDFQLKIRGFRIEPGEVEAALLEHPALVDAVVVARGQAAEDRTLAAYVVAGQGMDAPSAAEVRAFARERLPEYMVPSSVVVMERLPLTPNGKVDRRALPDPEAAGDPASAAPRTPVEEVVAAIWADVLKVERVGAADGFFDLGGHSLLATRVVSRIREVFGVELPLRALFEAPTVEGLAARVEALRRVGVGVLGPVLPADRSRPIPLSFAQERLWFLHRLQPGSASYNVASASRLSGELHVPALEQALAEVVRRHESLRTVFREEAGGPVQVVRPFEGFTLPVEDLSALGEAECEATLHRRAADEAARPFDLAEGPLFRAALLRLGEGEHVLLLSLHHAVSDGWSSGILLREASALYAAFSAGAPSPLAELPVQYADFAAWQREQLQGPVLDRQLAWWRERLEGAPALLELPTDRPRPAMQRFRGAREPIRISRELADRLEALGRREGATLYMVLLGAFQSLLARWAGVDDVVVGTTIAGRTRAEVEALVGLFMNTLALRTDLSGDPSFREVLARVREVTLGAYEHQDVPFERLVEELRPERSLAHQPLVQVLFELQTTDRAPAALPGVSIRPVETEIDTAKFDLAVDLTPGPRGVFGVLSYSTDLFEPATARRMARHLERVLEQVAGDADVRLSGLALLDDEERRQVVQAWNANDAAYSAELCIHELFEAQAALTPGATAVTFGGESLTFAELDARANRLANHLRRLGVGPEVRVGLCLERSPELMVAILGVMKSGGAYVPVDPSHPAERIAYVMDDSAVALALTQERLAARLPGGLAALAIDTAWDEIASESADAPETGVTSENLCYVIYTSGSTGRPKGVAMHHRGVVNYIEWGIGFYGADQGDGSPVFSSMAVDLTITNLLPLFAGKPVHLLPEENAVEALAAVLKERRGFGAIKITPVHLSLLTPLLSADEAREAAHTLVIGADFLSAEPTVFWQDHAPGVRLMNEYGPTETVVGCSAYVLPNGVHRHGAVPVGGAIQNLKFYVLDARMQPVPAGFPGELYIGGAGVARGYLGRPSLSAEKFVPDPFAAPGERMYRTGDRARWLDGGNLMILGRTDNQVKVRGYRVELGEIEAVLRRHPAVSGALVVVREDAPGDRRLVAYVVGDAETEALRDHLRAALPGYMVPNAFVRLETLPKTATGKIDPKTLPAPEYGGQDDFVAARTPTEEVLAGIWAEVLRVERVGATDGFFTLGGHSLLATRVVSRVREVFGVELPLRALFESPTVAGLAARVDELRRAGDEALPPVVPAGRDRPLPLSFAQERLWFLDRMEPGRPVYNIPATLRITGALDVAALERALGEVVRRHESLRTAFGEAGGAPVQVVSPFSGFTLSVTPVADEAEASRLASDEAARPFDLAAGPLFRASLLQIAPDDHVLLVTLHHAVSDGWSMAIFQREMLALYAACRAGAASPLAELPVQYADYAVWQRERLQGPALDRQLAYWTARLAGAPELLELPTDRPRPAVQDLSGAREPVELPAALLEPLQALARSEGATLYMVLLAAFQVLLAKYAGSDDVVVGSPIAGRTRQETEGVIGFFVNTLALRAELGGDPAFREAVRRVRAATLGAYENQDVPFERLVAELRPERSLSHSPLFQVMFTLDTAEPAGAAAPGLAVRRMATEVRTVKHDLLLGLATDGRSLRGELAYATALFDRETVVRMLAHFGRLLEQAAADPDLRLSQIELMDQAERRQVLEEWNRTAVEYPSDRAIHSLFEEHAAATPRAVALVAGDEEITYAELNARANRLARHLAARGVTTETPVGICLERRAETVVAILAVLKAGGAYVPLDPGYPAGRLAHMLADSGARVVVTRAADRTALPVTDGIDRVEIDVERDAIAARDASDLGVDVGGRNLAYVIYTSGSTGTPKGVGVEHRSVVRLVRGADFAGFGPETVMLQAAPVSFDASTLELWAPLLNGGRVVAAPSGALSLEELGRTLVRHGVNLLWLTAGLFQAMVEERLEDLAGVRQLIAGGDVLPPAQVARVRERFPHLRLINGYGPTENTTFTCCHTVGEEWGGGRVPIGTPISSTRVSVLDASLRPVPAGVAGELFAGGHGVARGYLGHPAATAERFVPDPFAPEPGARMYRTGDRVRWTNVRECVSAEVRGAGADDASARAGQERTGALTHSRTAVLDYLGRLDAQAKIRGFRIEPGEVETALRRAPGVAECVVVAREDLPGDRRLVAYVVSEASGEADAEALRAHLLVSLPDYMVPAAFVAIGSVPLTPNGKVDRAALPAPEYAGEAGRYAAPRTPAEEVLAGIWAEVLSVDRVGRDDGFFELGGHSLLATRVVSRVREAFAVELPLRAVFEASTVAALAARVEALRRAGDDVLPPVVPVDRGAPLPLSFSQERLWFLDRLEPGKAVYNIPSALRLSGVLSVPALERALGEVVRRHESLRTVFHAVDGSPAQVVAPFAGFHLPVDDLSALEADEREAEVGRRAADDASRPFDLAAGPLFRAALLRLAEREHVLLVCMHHSVSDGWSMGIFQRELLALYAAFREGRPSPLAELPVQYADFAAWQRGQLQGPALDRQLAYWKERLAGAPALLELPTDRPRPAVQSFRGARVPVALSGALLERLEALGRREGATLYMVLLAGFQALLARYAGMEDVVVGSPIAGRGRRETEELIGFFVNTLVLRTDLSGDPAFADLLRRVREATLGAYENQDVPFERLVAELHPERSLSHSPLFQVLFTLQTAEPAGLVGIPGLAVRGVDAEADKTQYDLTLSLSARPGGATGVLEYRTDLFDRATVERMAGHLVRLLEQVAGEAALPLSRLELMDEGERRRVVEEWSGADAEYQPRAAHHLVADQAARTPGAVALRMGPAELTYAEMEAAANRLAHHLAARGARPGSVVAVAAERGPATVICMLAAMKAGAAYLPLDPAYPAERLCYMLADSGASLLVSAGALPAGVEGDGLPPVVQLRAEAEAVAARPDTAPEVDADPASAAYVIYTSGSTGRPKGVVVPHHGVRSLVGWLHGRCGLGAGDRVLQFASFSFDASVEEVLGALTAGATLVLAERQALIPGDALRDTLRRERVSFATLPPSVLAVMDPADFPGLRAVISAGEALAPAVAERWAAAVELHNGYGPTEVTVCASSGRATPDAAGRAPSIGAPLDHARAYVLDAWASPVPAGIPGELYVGGAGVARGYLNRPALTAEKFVPDPFSPVPGARLYRTGDRVRWTESAEVRECVSAPDPRETPDPGETQRTSALTHSRTAVQHSRTAVLEYLGRIDAQVKIRGFRIEPGEVEAALHDCPGVDDCAVVVRQDTPGERRLVAYTAGAAGENEVRAWLRRTLPEYMVPARVVRMDALPVTPNGKVDRRALPAPAAAPSTGGGRRLKPENGTEARVAAIWQELLGIDDVGAEDNFFDLGGHSLLLIRLQARLQAELGREVPVVELFQFPTVRTLAARLEQGGAAKEDVAAAEGEERGAARQAAVNRRLEARRRRDG
jgi:amino acid adenylation domain-containing protein